jgi:hypothetical protein
MKRVLLVLVAVFVLAGCAVGVRPAPYYGSGYSAPYYDRPVVVRPAPYYNNGYYVAPQRVETIRIERSYQVVPRHQHYRGYHHHNGRR